MFPRSFTKSSRNALREQMSCKCQCPLTSTLIVRRKEACNCKLSSKLLVRDRGTDNLHFSLHINYLRPTLRSRYPYKWCSRVFLSGVFRSRVFSRPINETIQFLQLYLWNIAATKGHWDRYDCTMCIHHVSRRWHTCDITIQLVIQCDWTLMEMFHHCH